MALKPFASALNEMFAQIEYPSRREDSGVFGAYGVEQVDAEQSQF
jgi:hypothetical protein